jgi:signal recognition particle receptor subunit beta
MPAINFPKREISCKIVYCGPGLSGKTTNLQVVHAKAPKSRRGELTSIATEGERTLFFDYMPLDLGKVGGMRTKFQLYTVPGQEYYKATRRLVLRGADGVVFVADSQVGKMDENIQSLEDLKEHLADEGITLEDFPLVLQWNKRDMPNVMSVKELERRLNRFNSPAFEASAVNGEGVFQTLKRAAELVLKELHDKWGLKPNERPTAPAGGTPAVRPARVKLPRPEPSAREEAPEPVRALPPALHPGKRHTPRASEPEDSTKAVESPPRVAVVTGTPSSPRRGAHGPRRLRLLVLLSLLASSLAVAVTLEWSGIEPWICEIMAR